MAVKRIKIGDIGKISREKEETTKWMKITAEAAVMTEEEVQEYSDNHFSKLSKEEREGIEFIFKVSWALAKIQYKDRK